MKLATSGNLNLAVDSGQTPQEIAASVGPGSAAGLAMDWVSAVLNQDWIWALTHSTAALRKDWTGQWVSWAASNGMFSVADAAAIHDGLLSLDPTFEWFDPFAELATYWMEQHLGQPDAVLSVGSGQRPLDVDRALVLIVDYNELSAPESGVHPGAEGKIVSNTPIDPLFKMVMSWNGDEWLVESWESRLTFEQEANDEN